MGPPLRCELNVCNIENKVSPVQATEETELIILLTIILSGKLR